MQIPAERCAGRNPRATRFSPSERGPGGLPDPDFDFAGTCVSAKNRGIKTGAPAAPCDGLALRSGLRLGQMRVSTVLPSAWSGLGRGRDGPLSRTSPKWPYDSTHASVGGDG